jgi:hypothetical protein
MEEASQPQGPRKGTTNLFANFDVPLGEEIALLSRIPVVAVICITEKDKFVELKHSPTSGSIKKGLK